MQGPVHFLEDLQISWRQCLCLRVKNNCVLVYQMELGDGYEMSFLVIGNMSCLSLFPQHAA